MPERLDDELDPGREAVHAAIEQLRASELGVPAAIRLSVEGGKDNVSYLVWALKGSAPKNVEVPE